MTNKEAIEQLKWVQKRICDITYSPESFEAINLAIEALEVVDDVHHTVYRNEKCKKAGRCYDYIGYHCAGCKGE